MDGTAGVIQTVLTEQAKLDNGEKTGITDHEIKCFILDFLNAGKFEHIYIALQSFK